MISVYNGVHFASSRLDETDITMYDSGRNGNRRRSPSTPEGVIRMIIHPGLVRFLSGFTFAILVAGCDVAFIGLLDALLPFSLSTIVYQTIFIFLCVIMFPAFCVVECSASNECHDYALYAARGS